MKTQTNNRPYPLLLLLIITLALSACATTPPGERAKISGTEILKKAQDAENRGDLEGAAVEYSRLAALNTAPLRHDYELHAATILLNGNFTDQAQRILQAMNTGTMTETQRTRKQILDARIALSVPDPSTALRILSARFATDIPPELGSALHELRADAYFRLNKLIDSARERILRESLLSDPEMIQENQLILWQTLLMIPDPVFRQLSFAPPPDVLSGWLELLNILKLSTIQAIRIDQKIAEWRMRYPQHPASESIIASLLERQEELAKRPANIALLLPLSGPFEKPAAALRDGFITAHYKQDKGENKTVVRIYNTDRADTNIRKLYQQAIDDGAEFIVGPLSKPAITELVNRTRISVPTLTLNYLEDRETSQPDLYQFGLAPEDEARQLAERAWLDGHNQAIAILPDNDWGARIYDAFIKQWQQLGGTVLEHQTYAQENNDFSAPLKSLLNLDESETRASKLKQLIGQDFKFEPRRRSDADFIFMAAFPRQARLIRPQLKFHYASSLPVYATSHIFSGKLDRHADRDMDGVIFSDTPWILSNIRKPDELQKEFSKLWPEQYERYMRFFALGLDAYELLPQLHRLKTYQHERFNGKTGTLLLDESNRIYRLLQWARFSGGIPRPL